MTRIAKSIYKDAYGYEARACVNGVVRLKRFPPDAHLRTMKQWQQDECAAIRRDRPAPSRGTLAADAQTYLKRVEGMTSFDQRTMHINWWVAQLGHRRRDSIKPKDIEAALATLTCAASTYNHYRTALAHLWRTLDGANAHNPVREVEKRTEDAQPPRAIPDDILETALARLPQPLSATSARLLVLAHTGLPPSLVMTLTPEDIDLINATVRVKGRHKGAGVDGRVLPLTAQGVVAFTEFVKANAFGRFSHSSLRKAWKRACQGFPGIRVYDLRHTFLTKVLLATRGNLEAVAGMAMHASLATTKRYTRAAVPSMLRDAVDALNATAVLH